MFGPSTGNDNHGVTVVDVKRDSHAYREGFRAGDVITTVNRQHVESVADFETAIRSTDTDDALVLNVLRGDAALFIVIS